MAVMTRSLLVSAIALAVVSVILTIILFQLDAPLAAVLNYPYALG